MYVRARRPDEEEEYGLHVYMSMYIHVFMYRTKRNKLCMHVCDVYIIYLETQNVLKTHNVLNVYIKDTKRTCATKAYTKVIHAYHV